jgi:hypothetical protein
MCELIYSNKIKLAISLCEFTLINQFFSLSNVQSQVLKESVHQLILSH